MYLGTVELMHALSEFAVRTLVVVWSNVCSGRGPFSNPCTRLHLCGATRSPSHSNWPKRHPQILRVCLDLALSYGCNQQVIVRKIRGANGGLVGFDHDRHDPQ
jgi:hypothetical protein